MNNPFEIIESRLGNIENLILDIKHLPKYNSSLLLEDKDPKNIDEIVELTGYKKKTLYGYCQNNTIPHHKKNGRLFFFKAEIIDWIQSGKQKTIKEIEAENDDFFASKNKRSK
ncbi:helix-turn-helix domain-containing protein [Polaribacter sp. IC063]|jgi:predicted DNA-binding transcriptional regulator AlpA|uniref:helix-turn-helix domain-containing protein n=1 Tax=Polaribacter sp. IC063 TaxID=57031 RepID=UPI0011BE0C61|nr:helix-turn-helix domain-containing protein [Polaribacter sp. IC063]TXD53911.1 helix-turn-helix domain-containing protein [Polaribacter sp. IC063]